MLILSFFKSLASCSLILRKDSSCRNLESHWHWLIYWLFLKFWYLKSIRLLYSIIPEKLGLLYYWILKNYILERALSSKHFPKANSNLFFMLYFRGLIFFSFFSLFPSLPHFLAQGFQSGASGHRRRCQRPTMLSGYGPRHLYFNKSSLLAFAHFFWKTFESHSWQCKQK